MCWLVAGRTVAQSDPVREGIASSGLCGLAHTAFPTCPTRVGLTATGGYGYTEGIGPVPGAHYRFSGALGAGVVPLRFLALALRLDGRYDLHPNDTLGADKTGTGEPRLFVRAGHDLTDTLSLGAEAVVWVPGSDAPSLEPLATTLDLKVLAAYRAARLHGALVGHAGMRLDQSERTTPDLNRVRAGDRISLNVSDSNAVLLGLGLTSRAVAESELFGELALDLLVGPKAPRFAESPFRATLGARRFFSRRAQGELSVTIGLSARPDVRASAPLVPIEPRLHFSAGFRYGIPLYEPPPPPPHVEVVPEPTSTTITGVLVDAEGAPVPDVRVVLLRNDDFPRETVTDGDGRYQFENVTFGAITLEAHASGFETHRWSLAVGPRMEPAAARPLSAKGSLGTLRVLSRTFTSEPIQAAILVRDQAGQKVADGRTDDEGLFEFDLPPGRYTVMISAPGHRPHRREVQIERYGVAILNVDMREAR